MPKYILVKDTEDRACMECVLNNKDECDAFNYFDKPMPCSIKGNDYHYEIDTQKEEVK